MHTYIPSPLTSLPVSHPTQSWSSSMHYLPFRLVSTSVPLSSCIQQVPDIFWILSQLLLEISKAIFGTLTFWISSVLHLVFATLCNLLGLEPTRLHCLWDFSGRNTGVGCHFLLQGIFLTQGSNPQPLCLLHCRQILYQLSHRGHPFYTFLCP